MPAFVASLIFVTLAEIGDKTQLLAMAFATRFPARAVLAAVVVLLAAPILARHTSGARLRRVAEARVTIASGLLLLGIAAQILVEHVR